MPASARSNRAEPQNISSGAAASAQQEALLREALEKEAAEQRIETALQNMEERWVMRRHRDIANQMVDEQRHAAIAVWAERRARVEEEMAYSAEAMRFQCELWQRATELPADAEEDIAPTAPPDKEKQELQDSAKDSSRKRSEMATTSLPPRIDVSGDQQVRFAPETITTPRLASFVKDPTKVDRITHLRYIHRHLLQGSELAEEEDEDDHGDSDVPTDSIFQTEVSACAYQHVSLSTYTADASQALVATRNQDDADVVAAVCDRWPQCAPMGKECEAGTGANLHELRFKQQQEAEAVKRRLTRRNCPFNASAVEGALVMPSHFVRPERCVFNTEPNLKTPGMPSWYLQDPKKKKAQKGRKTGGGRRKSREEK